MVSCNKPYAEILHFTWVQKRPLKKWQSVNAINELKHSIAKVCTKSIQAEWVLKHVLAPVSYPKPKEVDCHIQRKDIKKCTDKRYLMFLMCSSPPSKQEYFNKCAKPARYSQYWAGGSHSDTGYWMIGLGLHFEWATMVCGVAGKFAAQKTNLWNCQWRHVGETYTNFSSSNALVMIFTLASPNGIGADMKKQLYI